MILEKFVKLLAVNANFDGRNDFKEQLLSDVKSRIYNFHGYRSFQRRTKNEIYDSAMENDTFSGEDTEYLTVYIDEISYIFFVTLSRQNPSKTLAVDLERSHDV